MCSSHNFSFLKREFVPHYLIILSFSYMVIMNHLNSKRINFEHKTTQKTWYVVHWVSEWGSKSRSTSEALLLKAAAATVCIHLVALWGNVAGCICVTLGLQSNRVSFHFLPLVNRSLDIHAKLIDRCLLDNKSIIFCSHVCYEGWGRAISTATSYRLDGLGIESWWGQDFLHPSRPALGLTQPPTQWVLELSRG